MQYNAADSSLQVDLQQTLQLMCSDSVVAFQDSQLSSGDSTQSVSALRAAVATASRAKAAEVERLMAESQKVMHKSSAQLHCISDSVTSLFNVRHLHMALKEAIRVYTAWHLSSALRFATLGCSKSKAFELYIEVLPRDSTPD